MSATLPRSGPEQLRGGRFAVTLTGLLRDELVGMLVGCGRVGELLFLLLAAGAQPAVAHGNAGILDLDFPELGRNAAEEFETSGHGAGSL